MDEASEARKNVWESREVGSQQRLYKYMSTLELNHSSVIRDKVKVHYPGKCGLYTHKSCIIVVTQPLM